MSRCSCVQKIRESGYHNSQVNKAELWPVFVNKIGKQAEDHFITVNGKSCAGTHLIIDLWEAERINDLKLMESAMRRAVEVSGATLLHIHLHHFSPNGGISGVAVLAESHISVHTWPERAFAAFDVFMCGNCVPEKAVSVLKDAFSPGNVIVQRYMRGMVE